MYHGCYILRLKVAASPKMLVITKSRIDLQINAVAVLRLASSRTAPRWRARVAGRKKRAACAQTVKQPSDAQTSSVFLMIAVPMLVIGGNALDASAQVLGLGGATLQGIYSCKGQGHGANGAPTGAVPRFTVNGGAVSGGELGTHVNAAFCFFTITGGTASVDSDEVGRLALNLQRKASRHKLVRSRCRCLIRPATG